MSFELASINRHDLFTIIMMWRTESKTDRDLLKLNVENFFYAVKRRKKNFKELKTEYFKYFVSILFFSYLFVFCRNSKIFCTIC